MNARAPLSLALLALVLFAHGEARADAVGPGPPDCPAGSHPEVTHSNEWCQATPCDANVSCRDGLTCATTSLCVHTAEVTGGGDMQKPFTVAKVIGTCATSADCTGGAVCVTADRCTSARAPTTTPPAPGPMATTSPTSGVAPATKSSCAAAPLGASFLVLALALAARRRRARAGLTFIALAWLGHGEARADAVGPGPPDCPAGSHPESSHSGEWCQATLCDAKTQCSDGLTCAPTSLCIRDVELTGGGRRSSDEPPPVYKVAQVVGTCTKAADCTGGAQCVTTDRCISASATRAPSPPPPPTAPTTNPPSPPTTTTDATTTTPSPPSSPTSGVAPATESSCAAAPLGASFVVLLLALARRRRVRTGLVCIALAWLAHGEARADVVGRGPPGCPEGSRPRSTHSGDWCAAAPCDAATPCSDGLTCAATSLCIDTVDVTSGGRRPPNTPPAVYKVAKVVGTCTTQGDCTGAAVCVTADRCTSAAPAPTTTAPATTPPATTPPATAPPPISPTTAAPATTTPASSCAATPLGLVSGALALPLALAVRRRRA